MGEPTLAERIVAHPLWSRDGFGWMPGMAFFDWVGDRGIVPLKRTARKQAVCRSMLSEVTDDGGRCLPDIHNPGTQGHLMAQIQAVSDALWQRDWTHVLLDGDGYAVFVGDHVLASGNTLGVAIAAGLHAALDRLVEQEAG